MKIRINTPLLLLIVTAAVALSAATYGIYVWQSGRSLEELRAQIDSADQAGQTEELSRLLRLYVGLRPEDTDALLRYAQLRDRLATETRGRQEALYLYGKVLDRPDLNEPEPIRRRFVTLATRREIAQYRRALVQLDRHLIPGQPEDLPLRDLAAQCHIGLGQIDEAQAVLESVVEDHPDFVPGYVRLIDLLLDQSEGTPPQVQELMTAMVAANPESPQAYLERSRLRSRLSLPGDDEDLAQALELGPEDPEVLIESAKAALIRDEVDRAQELVETAFQFDPESVEAQVVRARVATLQGRHEEAIAILEAALAIVDSDALEGSIRWDLANSSINAGRLEEAETRIRDLRERAIYAPASIDTLEARIAMARPEPDWARAMDLLVRALDNQADRPEELIQTARLLAECAERMGNPSRQVEALQAILLIEPGRLRERLQLATALEQAGQLDQAAVVLEPIADRSPVAARLLMDLSVDLQLRRSPERRNWAAVEARLDQLTPPLPALDASLLRSQLLFNQGQFSEAEAVLNTVRTQLTESMDGESTTAPDEGGPVNDGSAPPNDPISRVDLALAKTLSLQGRWDEAAELIDRVDQQVGEPTPEVAEARINLSATRAPAEGSDTLQDVRSALADQDDPSWYPVIGLLSSTLYRLGDPEGARDVLFGWAEAHPFEIAPLLELRTLAISAQDRDALADLIERLKAIEGEGPRAVNWRLAEAAWLLMGEEGPPSPETLEAIDERLNEIERERPDWAQVAVARGTLHELNGEIDEAIQDYQTALRSGNRSARTIAKLLDLLHRSGQAQLVQNRPVRASELFTRAAQILDEYLTYLPDDTVTRRLMADVAVDRLLVGQGDRVEALTLIEQAVPTGTTAPNALLWRALKLAALGADSEADADFARAASLAPDSARIRLEWIAHRVRTERLEEARTLLENATAEDSEIVWGPDQLARAWELVGDTARALEQHEQVLKQPLMEVDPDAVEQAIVALVARGQLDRARTELEEILRQADDPNAPPPASLTAWARRNLASLLLAQSSDVNAAEATRSYSKALSLIEENLTTSSAEDSEDQAILNRRIKAALLFVAHDRADEAIALLRELIDELELETRESSLSLMLAKLLDTRGDWNDAREIYQQLIVQVAEPVERLPLLVNYIDALLRHDEISEVPLWLSELDDLASGSLDLIRLRSRYLDRRGDRQGVETLVRSFVAEDASRSPAAVQWLTQLGYHEAAEQLLRDELERGRQQGTGDDPERSAELTLSLARQGRLDEAITLARDLAERLSPQKASNLALQIVNQMEPEDQRVDLLSAIVEQAAGDPQASANALFDLANIRIRQERYDEAQAILDRLQAIIPNHPTVLNNIAYMLALQGGRSNEAVRFATRAIEVFGSHGAVLDTRGLAYLSGQRGEEALLDLDQAVTLETRSPEIRFHRAWALSLVGREDEAVEEFGRALDLGLQRRQLHPTEANAFDQLLDLQERKQEDA